MTPDSDGSAGVAEKARIGLLLALGIAVPGVLNHVLHSVGYTTLGKVVWVLGFGTVVLAVWAVWIRPLDLEGSAGRQ